VVLDTNTILARWWFGDPVVAALGIAVESGRLSWLATAAMRRELESVLQRGLPGSGNATAETVLGTFDVYAGLVPEASPSHRLLCTDPSDQMFIDLAMGQRARWLFSRDRAVLKLRRRAQAWGVDIIRPDGWQWPETQGA
jgi:uncharacterized protein